MTMFARIALLVAWLLGGSVLAGAQDAALREGAIDGAIDIFERALPQLAAVHSGVDVAAYRDALTLQRFQSAVWGGAVSVTIAAQGQPSGSCKQFAAFVRIPPQGGVAPLVLCPKFFTPGADGLRALTILHEMVHVVAGPDECQAMAFAARVEQAANGQWTPVDGYWQASGCDGSGFSLPE